jgi:23S rRNA (cytosine1962-C5)-methyltransferase
MKELERAWSWRESRGMLSSGDAIRVFHGPGEGSGALQAITIDRFGDSCWVTEREGEKAAPASLAGALRDFLESRGVRSAVALWRPRAGIPETAEPLLGETAAPDAKSGIEAREDGARYSIRFSGVRHPGLFLDHAPLRRWLRERASGWRVLNTFAYTGSLSVAAGLGGASHVTTLDLSGATVDWASANWRLNGLAEDKGRFIAGDVFERLPRFHRQGEAFDCVILDPPSFSRGKKGSFSTAKDLVKLHELAIDLLAPGGVLVTSINSANVSAEKFRADVLAAARARAKAFDVLAELSLPDTFPTRLERPEDRYLKGWCLRLR